MKKIGLFFVALVLIGICTIKTDQKYTDAQRVEFYVSGNIQAVENAECISVGGDTIVVVPPVYAEQTEKNLKGITAVTVVYNGLSSKEAFKRVSALEVFREDLGDVVSIYGYTPKLNVKPVSLKGEVINIQVAERNGNLYVGYPVLKTDY